MKRTQCIRLFVVLLLFAVAIADPTYAQATQTLYGAIGDYLVRVNPVTGKATVVAPFTFPAGVESILNLAFDQNTQVLYGLGLPPFPPLGTPTLVTINPCTGDVTAVGAVTVPGGTVHFAEGLAVNPAGVLYISMSINGDNASGDFFSESLATVNPVTAVTTVVATISGTPNQEADGLEFVGSTLFATDGPNFGVYTIDLGTGVATFVGVPTSPTFMNLGDLA